MTSQADFDAFVESQRSVRKLALRDVAAWWALYGHLQGDELERLAMLDIPAIAATYGEISSTAAATFYEAARADAFPSSTFRAIVAESNAGGEVARNVKWALSGDDPLARLSKAVDMAALQDGRDTIMRNNERDPKRPRFARVPVGKTCAWCVMLGARGAVYRTAESAGKGRKYHGNCDCQPTPSWAGGDDLPPSYDEGFYYGLYDRARAESGSRSVKKILAAMRRLDGGIHFTDGVKPSI